MKEEARSLEEQARKIRNASLKVDYITLRRGSEYWGKGASDRLMKQIADALHTKAYAHMDADLWTRVGSEWKEYAKFKGMQESLYKKNYLSKEKS